MRTHGSGRPYPYTYRSSAGFKTVGKGRNGTCTWPQVEKGILQCWTDTRAAHLKFELSQLLGIQTLGCGVTYCLKKSLSIFLHHAATQNFASSSVRVHLWFISRDTARSSVRCSCVIVTLHLQTPPTAGTQHSACTMRPCAAAASLSPCTSKPHQPQEPNIQRVRCVRSLRLRYRHPRSQGEPLCWSQGISHGRPWWPIGAGSGRCCSDLVARCAAVWAAASLWACLFAGKMDTYVFIHVLLTHTGLASIIRVYNIFNIYIYIYIISEGVDGGPKQGYFRNVSWVGTHVCNF